MKWLKKLKKWQIVVLLLLFFYIIGITTEDDKEPPKDNNNVIQQNDENKEKEKDNKNKNEKIADLKKEDNDNSITNENNNTTKQNIDEKDELKTIFSNLNLSDKQLDSISTILKNVGATNFTLKKHNYSDASKDLCLFRGEFKQAKNLQVNITMENGKIFNVELAGLPKGSYWDGAGEAIKLYYEGKYLGYYDQANNRIVDYKDK